MQYILFLLLFGSLRLFGMEAPPKPAAKVSLRPTNVPWKNTTQQLQTTLTENARKTILLNEKQAQQISSNIKLARQKSKPEASNKLIVLVVYKGDEPYANLLANPQTKTNSALAQMAVALAQTRFTEGPEKGRPLASSLSELDMSNSEIDLISYAYGQQEEAEAIKLLDLFVHSLEILNETKNLKIAIIAEGESAHIVNLMSREAKIHPIDSLIYFQSPLYEWVWGVFRADYYHDESMSPANFRHLYHIYTKGTWQVPTRYSTYLERKYRQQARVENGQLVSPVKNIRALKVDQSGELVDLKLDDFFTEYAIAQYVKLFEQADSYQVNSDLITKLFDQASEPPSTAINRFVRLNGGNLEQPRATSVIGAEYFYPVIEVSKLSLPALRRAFSLEVEESLGQLINITSIPTPEGWFVVKKVIGDVSSDIARIKEQHIKVLSSPLYEFKTRPEAEQFSFIISDRVRAALVTIADTTGLSASFVEGQMKLGAYFMNLLLTNQEASIPARNQEEYLRSIIALIWFFYSQAIENKQLFEEGTFVIEDVQWRLNDFLMRYVKIYGNPISGMKKQTRVNQPLQGTIADPDLNMSFNSFAYPRESSHFKVSQKTFRHYGIDIRFGNSGELPLLPAGKRHLLFGKIDEEKHLLFIKPENYGIYYKDGFIYHGAEFVESKVRKFGLTTKSDDDPSYAKERIPTEFLKEFNQALAVSNIPEEEKKKLQALALQDNWGMKILYFDDLLAKPAIAVLEKKYALMYDHLRLRTGREVILTHQDLQDSLRIERSQAAQQPQVAALHKPLGSKRVRTV